MEVLSLDAVLCHPGGERLNLAQKLFSVKYENAEMRARLRMMTWSFGSCLRSFGVAWGWTPAGAAISGGGE